MAQSYKDPIYDELDAGVESRLGLPTGLLTSIRTKGERSNADQVSSASAKTVYQHIPETRDAIIKKYKIDPWLSPENAALGAGYLLKEGLDRNRGNAAEAVGEYIGGIDRKNWGPVTRAYINRVMVGQKQAEPAEAAAPTQGRSLRAELAKDAPSATPSIAKIYAAYQGGQMSPEQEKEFEADVQSGAVLLPRKASLKVQPASDVVPDAVLEAYTAGKMSLEQVAEFEGDIKSGAIKLPAGISMGEPEKPGMLAQIKDVFTGELRATPETMGLPEWTGMPELNQLSAASAKTGLGTMFAPSSEVPQIIKAQFPGVEIRQDEKGNSIIKSSVDGKEYAIPPGLTMGDIPRVLGGIAAFGPAGGAASLGGLAAGSAATQAAIEATQAATGGEFNPAEVAVAGAAAPIGALVARGVGASIQGVQRTLNKGGAGTPEVPPIGAAPVRPAAPPVAAAVPEAAPVAPAAAPVAEMSQEQIASLAKKAATAPIGKAAATEQLAAQASPSRPVVEAAERLKMELDPDFVTDNEQFRRLVGLTRSQAGSEAESRGIAVVSKAAEKADEALESLGASKDLASVSDKVKGSLSATRDALEKSSDTLYAEIDAAIPKTVPVELPALRARIDQVTSEMGGIEGLSGAEKQLAKMLDGPVTYGRLARERGLIGKALAGKESPYGSMEEGSLKQLYKAMAEDQLDAVTAIGGEGLRDKYRLASQTVAKRKALEKRIVQTFGKDNSGSLVPALRNSISAATRGDDKGLNKLIQTIPEPLRKEALSSALLTYASGTTKGGQFGFSQYAKMYQGMRNNSPVYAAVVKTLGEGSDELLTDLYQVSQAISKAQAAVLQTGKANQGFLNTLKGPETLVGKVMEGAAGAAARGAVAEAATSMAFGPTGMGFMAGAVQAAASGRKDAMKAVGDLLTSPEFKDVVNQAATRGFSSEKSVARLAKAREMKRYSAFMSDTFKKDVTEREKWINAAIQSGRGKDKEKQPIAGQGEKL